MMRLNNIIKQYVTRLFTAQMAKIIHKHDIKIIAVAGSLGKTTTKMAIATILSESRRVCYQAGNYNTPISLPFIILNRPMPNLYNPVAWLWAWLQGQKLLYSHFPYDVVVVELGVDAPGDMQAFQKFLHPTIAVLTAISEEHMEFFKTIEAVAAEELAVAGFSDRLVLNADNVAPQYLRAYLPNTTPVDSYGLTAADYQVALTPNYPNGFIVKVTKKDVVLVDSQLNMIARHIIESLVAAVVVADLLGLEPAAIQTGLTKIKPFSGRMQLLTGIKQSTIIDDSYNASPPAVRAALETLYDFPSPQRIAILGMMNELGDYSKSAHEAIGRLCDPHRLALVVTIGHDANRYLAKTAAANGCRVLTATNPVTAGQMVANIMNNQAVILVKGSQNGVFAEEAIKPLLANPEDSRQLVRQSRFWLRKKASQFKSA